MSGIDSDKTPFMNYSTGAGEGKRRLGTVMVLKEDLYAVLYCSLIKVEYRERQFEEDTDATQREFGLHHQKAGKLGSLLGIGGARNNHRHVNAKVVQSRSPDPSSSKDTLDASNIQRLVQPASPHDVKVESINNSGEGEECQEEIAATNNQEMQEKEQELTREERMAKMHMMHEKLGLQKGATWAPEMMGEL